MKYRNRTVLRPLGPLGAVCLLLGIALLSLWATGCSGEMYRPGEESLTLPPQESEPPTGERFELGEDVTDGSSDPYKDSPHVLRADFLETGESDAILLQVDGTVILVDTGETDDYGTISRCLHQYGISEIDYLILTHFDKDHIGSAAAILQNFGVKTVYLPDYVRDSSLYHRMMGVLELLPDTKIQRVTQELTVDLTSSGDQDAPEGRMVIYPTALYEGGVTLGEDEENPIEENNFSLVISISFGQRSLLLMGDAEKDRIREVTEVFGGEPRYDLVKIPHHGDYNKALREFLLPCKGLSYCVVHTSAPTEVEASLTALIQEVGAEAYFTYDGCVRFATDGESMALMQD